MYSCLLKNYTRSIWSGDSIQNILGDLVSCALVTFNKSSATDKNNNKTNKNNNKTKENNNETNKTNNETKKQEAR